MWIPRFACPECSVDLVDADARVCGCDRCGNEYAHEDGLWSFLTPARRALLEPFLRQYRAVRERDRRRRVAGEYYTGLPWVPSDDPHAAEWRIRRESYGHLLRRTLSTVPEPIRILDLGAGNAWLSHRLAELGHHVVALDVLDDEADGLRAAKHYGIRFPAIQADYDALPFAPQQFDLVVFNGSLHYAPDPASTLAAAHRMLAPAGTLAVMDSPMFVRDGDGRAMAAGMESRLASLLRGTLPPGADGADRFIQPGPGYLTFAAIDASAQSLGLRAEFIPSRGSIGWRLRRRLGGLRLGRPPAVFGVWIAKERDGFSRASR
ncbi:MAG TPA: class I SAM-dependent methyltransferase [Vicinamibacterales bacterium]|nr:class I SAM-dependent methyltransferase [Vicinamibacterales bacterium]